MFVHCNHIVPNEYVTEVRDLRDHAVHTTQISLKKNPFENCLWEPASNVGDSIPTEISLGYKSCYNFELDMYLGEKQISGRSYNIT